MRYDFVYARNIADSADSHNLLVPDTLSAAVHFLKRRKYNGSVTFIHGNARNIAACRPEAMKRHSHILEVIALNIDHLRDSRTFSGAMLRCVLFTLLGVSALMGLNDRAIAAQQPSAQSFPRTTINGTVRDSAGKPVAGASVRIQQEGVSNAIETKTNEAGAYEFSALGLGSVTVTAEKVGFRSRPATVRTSSIADHVHIDLTLEGGASATSQAAPSAGAHPWSLQMPRISRLRL